jgi:hypothetical protein
MIWLYISYLTADGKISKVLENARWFCNGKIPCWILRFGANGMGRKKARTDQATQRNLKENLLLLDPRTNSSGHDDKHQIVGVLGHPQSYETRCGDRI